MKQCLRTALFLLFIYFAVTLQVMSLESKENPTESKQVAFRLFTSFLQAIYKLFAIFLQLFLLSTLGFLLRREAFVNQLNI